MATDFARSRHLRDHRGYEVAQLFRNVVNLSPKMLADRISAIRSTRHICPRARTTRWMPRVRYAANRFSKAIKVLEVRLWRSPLIRLVYSHTDYAPAPREVTLRLTSNCNLRCVQCG